jgi:hypothetical protein
MSEIPEYVSSAELAGFLGITQRRVNQCCKEGLFQRGANEKIDFRRAVTAHFRSVPDPNKAAQTELALARSRKISFDIKKELGLLQHPDEIRERYIHLMDSIIKKVRYLDILFVAKGYWPVSGMHKDRYDLETSLLEIVREIIHADIVGAPIPKDHKECLTVFDVEAVLTSLNDDTGSKFKTEIVDALVILKTLCRTADRIKWDQKNMLESFGPEHVREIIKANSTEYFLEHGLAGPNYFDEPESADLAEVN